MFCKFGGGGQDVLHKPCQGFICNILLGYLNSFTKGLHIQLCLHFMSGHYICWAILKDMRIFFLTFIADLPFTHSNNCSCIYI
jgi:hypothetical protein